MLAALLALTVMGGSNALWASDQGDKAKFQAAYSRYQQAIENKDAEAAASAAKEALNLGQGILPDDSPSMAALYVNYGMALVDAEEYENAIPPLKAGVKRLEKLHGKTHENLIDPLWARADAQRKLALNNDGILDLRRILRIVEETRGKDNFLFAEINLEIGEVLYFSSKQQWRAPEYLRAAYETYNRIYKRPAFKTGLAALWLGKSAKQLNRKKSAEEHFLDALRLFEDTSPPGHQLQIMAHTFLILLYEERGKSDQADAHCQAISLLRPQATVDGHKPLFKKMPIYPRGSSREGYVLVEFTVTPRGTVADPKIVESEGGKAFERSALEAVKYFRYAPAVKDGELIQTEGVRNLITYTLRKEPSCGFRAGLCER